MASQHPLSLDVNFDEPLSHECVDLLIKLLAPQFTYDCDQKSFILIDENVNYKHYNNLKVQILYKLCGKKWLPSFSIVTQTWILSSYLSCADESIIATSFAFGIHDNGKNFLFNSFPQAQYHELCADKKFPIVDKPFTYDRGNRNCFRFDAMHTDSEFILRIPLEDTDDVIRRKIYAENGNSKKQKSQISAADRARAQRPHGIRRRYNEILIKLAYGSVSHIHLDVCSIINDGDQYSVHVYFDYRYPPSVFIGAIDFGRRRKPTRVFEWSSAFNFPDVIDEAKKCNCLCVGMILTVNELINLVNQFDKRIKTSISFGFKNNSCMKDLIPRKLRLPDNSEIHYMLDCIESLGECGRLFLHKQSTKLETYSSERSLDFLKRAFVKLMSMNGSTTDICKQTNVVLNSTRTDSDYVKIAKAVITPTRTIFYPPEEMMGFPLVHQIKGIEKDLLRIVFKDDDFRSIQNFTVSDDIVQETAKRYFADGIFVGGCRYHYMGYSNSQLRENGAYFLKTDNPRKIINIINQVGEFKPEGVAKIMARFAQLFTQARRMKSSVSPDRFVQIGDFEGYCPGDPTKRHCFSDGCGSMSLKFARQLKKELQLDSIPSVVQFRFQGYKGILAVDPMLDKLKKIKKEQETEHENCIIGCDLVFRDSQLKFSGKGEGFHAVKHSSPSSVCLNKPLINVFDQVSAMQGNSCRRRIRNRIHELVDDNIQSIQKPLIDQDAFLAALRELPVYAVYNSMNSYTTLIDEPFFRSMVKSRAKLQLMLLNDKKQIAIPPSLGRNCFGIVDTTGLLQYGQVFVCITDDVNDSSANPSTKVITGPIMVTKNPVCNAGDLRRFDAVDIPALRCYRDVIVFPTNGPRPHPDEMAGSDLDGDEYTVIFDPKLLFCRNEPAFDYTPVKVPPKDVKINELIKESKLFFENYMVQDVIGSVAIAHLGNSDLYGINSDVCLNIAKKQTIAVDYAKTGVKTEELTNNWNGDLPPERIKHAADFLQRDHVPSYKSKRLLGQIHRKIQEYYDTIKAIVDIPEEVVCDEFITSFSEPEFRVVEVVSRLYDNYCRDVENIMQLHGVQSEGELFSQCFIELRNPFGTRDHDNSAFGTASSVQREVIDLFASYRVQFYEKCSIRFDRELDSKGIIRDVRGVNFPAKQLAAECYRCAYKHERKRFLSFPWIAWEALNVIRRDHNDNIVLDPINEIYSKDIESFYQTYKKQEIVLFYMKKHFPSSIPYLNRYHDLKKLISVLYEWRRNISATFNTIPCSILIPVIMRFCLGKYPHPKGFVPVMEHTDAEKTYELVKWPNLGRILISFFETLAMREFLQQDYLHFGEFAFHNYPEADFDSGNISNLHYAAVKTYTSIAFNLRNHAWKSQLFSPIQEGKPFVISIPTKHAVAFTQSIDLLEKMTSCKRIAIHVRPNFLRSKKWQNKDDERLRITILGEGTVEALANLKAFFSVDADGQGVMPSNCKNISRYLEVMQDNIVGRLIRARNPVQETP